jgi:hypothetical protein
MNEVPVARHFLVCMSLETTGKGVTLHETIHTVNLLDGEEFPALLKSVSLFALLTNGRGEHDLSVELTRFVYGEEELVRPSWGPFRRNLGHDPTVVHGLPMNLKNIVFEEQGQYAFHLLCNEEIIAECQIFVR